MVYSVPDQKAIRIAQLLADEIVVLFGVPVPEALLLDRGTNLLSYLMKDVCKYFRYQEAQCNHIPPTM